MVSAVVDRNGGSIGGPAFGSLLVSREERAAALTQAAVIRCSLVAAAAAPPRLLLGQDQAPTACNPLQNDRGRGWWRPNSLPIESRQSKPRGVETRLRGVLLDRMMMMLLRVPPPPLGLT